MEVNGLRLTEPRQSYVRIWQALTGNKVIMELALKNLEKKFLGRPTRTTLLLLDEVSKQYFKTDIFFFSGSVQKQPHTSQTFCPINANFIFLP